MEEMILPGFRFHPTDEELVLFYLKRKVQQRPLSIELIRQLDIYKYDPWDLPSKPKIHFLLFVILLSQERFIYVYAINSKHACMHTFED